MVEHQRTNVHALSLRGGLLAGVSAVAVTFAAWTTPAIATPPQPHTYCTVGLAPTDTGIEFSTNRAFIQWAGITAGITESFYDFYSIPVEACRGYFPPSDTGDPGWLVFGYTAQLGSGLSATLAAETRRSVALYVPPLNQDVLSLTVNLGDASQRTSTNTLSAGSAGAPDVLSGPNAPGSATGNGFVGGVGARLPLGAFVIPGNAMPPPKSAPPVALPLAPFGVEAHTDFFAGGNQTIGGIPGGPFTTATGNDIFKIENKFLLTAGAWFALPVTPALRLDLSGGYAGLDRSMAFGCNTYCSIAPPTGPFTDTKDQWLNGAYVGGGLETPLPLGSLRGATFGVNYTHVFLGSDNVTFGNIATRTVTLNASGSMDMVTARVSVPLRALSKDFLP